MCVLDLSCHILCLSVGNFFWGDMHFISSYYRAVEVNFPSEFLHLYQGCYWFFNIFRGYKSETGPIELKSMYKYFTTSIMTSISTYFLWRSKLWKNANYAYLAEIFLSSPWAYFDTFGGLTCALSYNFQVPTGFNARLQMCCQNALVLK